MQLRSFPGFVTSSTLETYSAGSLTGAMMSSLIISRSSCFWLSLDATAWHSSRGVYNGIISKWYGLVIFLVPGKHLHICAVCQLHQSKASSLPALHQVCLYFRVHIHPLDRTDAKICLVAQQWLIVFTAHHFEVQIVITAIYVNFKCCGRYHFNFLPTLHSQCV